MIKWKFMPYHEGEMKTNPTESEFFTTTEVGNIATGLIREGIQNSLDESLYRNSLQKQPVLIKIFHSGEKNALKPDEYNIYFRGLKDHLNAKNSGIRNVVNFNTQTMQFLVFEDFNTNGLVGNPNESKDLEIEDKTQDHNFYHFWRNVGITGKPEDKLGRWGIGKTVFPVSSRINSFWGLTVQVDTGKEFLLGQAVLKSHNLTEYPQPYGYRPYGYFAHYDEGSLFPSAIDSSDMISDFKKTFQISRLEHESGLSIVIPFLREEITAANIITAIILQYYFPLIKQELVVFVRHEDETIEISDSTLANSTLDDVIDRYWNTDNDELPKKQTVLALFNFSKWAIGLGLAEFYNLKEQPLKNQPKWTEKLWEGLKQDEIINEFESSGRIAFRVPVKVHKADVLSGKTCWFKVFFEKDENLKTAETHFIRENLTIIDIKSIKNLGIRAMVLIEDKELSNLLGDSENPAHTQWQKDSQNFLDKYIHGDKCIVFVVNSISSIYQKLQKPAAGLERDILKNIFFVPIEEDDENGDIVDDDDSKSDDKGKSKVPEIPKGKRQMVRVSKIPGGVHVFPHEIFQDNLPEIELKLAYDTTRGNPLKKYQPLDFRLNKLPIKTIQRNCEFSFPEPNVIRLKPYKSDFEVTITGFDENRDLFINLKTQYPINDTEI